MSEEDDDLIKVYKQNPTTNHHNIIPLDFGAVDALPETHIWPFSGELSNRKETVPVIDLLDPNASQLMGSASQCWGMFQVINHGIPAKLVEDVEEEAGRLFQLPWADKSRVCRSVEAATGYGAARIQDFYPKLMWHEGFTIIGSCVHHAIKLWPNHYHHFCDTMDKWQKKMKSLAHRILILILKSLNIAQNYLDRSPPLSQTQGALQLNAYPICPDPIHAIGLPPHTDSLFLTILHQTQTDDGLQVFRPGFGWVRVYPVAGALVVNVGDMLHILSNGRLATAYHRAVVNQMERRISVGYFYGPAVDYPVGPLSETETPVYRSLSMKDYIVLKSKYLHEAFDLIRI